MEENTYNINYVFYNNLWYATGYAPLLGKVTQCADNKDDATNALYRYVAEVTDGGKHW